MPTHIFLSLYIRITLRFERGKMEEIEVADFKWVYDRKFRRISDGKSGSVDLPGFTAKETGYLAQFNLINDR